jgi:4-hydroxythreonine-4-phosphate dehydrogenase
VTQGDPDGVGPEVILRVAAADALCAGDVVVADPAVLAALARTLRAPWAAAGWESVQSLVVGEPGLGQFEALRRGVDLVLASPGAALVTAPIDKARARAEGLEHPGHTEYLAARAGTEVAMLMVGRTLRVALATIHVPLRRVAEVLTTRDVVRAATLLADGLRDRFGVRRPRIAVLGLNPHAGEGGLLGDEERTVIGPALEELARRHGEDVRFEGPIPADSAFFAHARGDFDGIVAMYHDQGLGPFKLVHFTDGVNMTLGLPFVRTSPDHGTARDIAGQGIADPASMAAAVALARGEAA